MKLLSLASLFLEPRKCFAEAVEDNVFVRVPAVLDDMAPACKYIAHACIAARENPAVQKVITLTSGEGRVVRVQHGNVCLKPGTERTSLAVKCLCSAAEGFVKKRPAC